jgi:hypothetical protein
MTKIKDKYNWNGLYKITVFDKNLNKIIREDVVNNTITNNARDEIIKPLYAATPNIEIKYLGIGTGTTASSAADTKLENEQFRTADNSLSRMNVGTVESGFTIQDTDYTGNICEIGIFCGSSATATKDTGTLLSRINWSHNKTADEEIYFERLDIIGG